MVFNLLSLGLMFFSILLSLDTKTFHFDLMQF